MAINFKRFCMHCRAWCCRKEKPYASKEELSKLKVDKISQKKDSSCIFLKDNKCSVYDKRPFECIIFPLNVERINGKLMWVLYDICPASQYINPKEMINNLEKELPKRFPMEYIKDYVNYDSNDPAGRYSRLKHKVIREICWN